MSGSRVDMKIVLLGKEYGGKTSLVERYLHGRFTGDVPYQSTIGAAFGAKKLDINGRSITLGIWDTAGSERYEAMSKIYYRGARAAIVCYDLTDRVSFERARFWVNEIRANEENCHIYLCGTKLDIVLEESRLRQVDYHNCTDYADEIKAQVFETSSKSGHGINDLFRKIAQDYADDPANAQTDKQETFELHDPNRKKLPCCE